MPQLIVIDRKGEQSVIDSESNQTAMEAIRNAGIDDLLALCGGVCSCATCHVYVDPAFAHRGVGRALVSQLLLNLAALRIERVETVVAPGDRDLARFFHAAGFAPSQRLAFVHRLAAA